MPNRISPRSRSALEPDLEDMIGVVEKANGYTPNSYMTLAHAPNVLRGFAALSKAILRDEGEVPKSLKFMVAGVSSQTAGCAYSQVHNFQSAAKNGVAEDRLRALPNFESSTLFSPAERAALVLSRAAASVPNKVTNEHFDELRKHFNERQIVELVAVIALFGWNNRWNSTMATELESTCLSFADKIGLATTGWNPKAHV